MHLRFADGLYRILWDTLMSLVVVSYKQYGVCLLENGSLFDANDQGGVADMRPAPLFPVSLPLDVSIGSE